MPGLSLSRALRGRLEPQDKQLEEALQVLVAGRGREYAGGVLGMKKNSELEAQTNGPSPGLRHLLARLTSAIKRSNLVRFLLGRDGRFVLLFHGILRRHYPTLPWLNQLGLTVEELNWTLCWVKSRFRLLTPGQFLEENHPGVLVTFDDGLANNYTEALPVLERHEVPAIFFISTQHVVNPRDWLPFTRTKVRAQWAAPNEVPEPWARELFDGMSVEQLRACARHPLITIGSHTVSHPFLTHCGNSWMGREIVGSRRQLEGLTGRKVDLFAYPSGDYDRMVAELVRAAGYRAAFAVASRQVGLPLYEIPRVEIYRAEPAYLDLKLSGLYRRSIGELNCPSAEG